jgi:hypothetical protein
VKDQSSEEDIVEVTDQNDREIEVVEELGSMPAAAEEGRAKCQRSRLCSYKKASSRNHALLDPPWHAACSFQASNGKKGSHSGINSARKQKRKRKEAVPGERIRTLTLKLL